MLAVQLIHLLSKHLSSIPRISRHRRYRNWQGTKRAVILKSVKWRRPVGTETGIHQCKFSEDSKVGWQTRVLGAAARPAHVLDNLCSWFEEAMFWAKPRGQTGSHGEAWGQNVRERIVPDGAQWAIYLGKPMSGWQVLGNECAEGDGIWKAVPMWP